VRSRSTEVPTSTLEDERRGLAPRKVIQYLVDEWRGLAARRPIQLWTAFSNAQSARSGTGPARGCATHRRPSARRSRLEAPSAASERRFALLLAASGLAKPPRIFRGLFGTTPSVYRRFSAWSSSAPASSPSPSCASRRRRMLGSARRADPGRRPFPDSVASDDEADVIEALGDEIATLAAHIHAATHRLLVLLAEFDRRGGWELEGHHSCATGRFRTASTSAQPGRRCAPRAAVLDLPRTGAAMARGELSFSQVRALTRVATADNEGDLLELARGAPRRSWSVWSGDGSAGAAGTRRRANGASREPHVLGLPDDDGMYVVRGKLPPEVGALLMRAVRRPPTSHRTRRGERLAGGSPSSDTHRAAPSGAPTLWRCWRARWAAGFGGRVGVGRPAARAR